MDDLETRVTRLETTTIERWDAHDKRSDARWSDLKADLIVIKDKVNSLQCPIHAERMKWLKAGLASSFAVIGAVIAWITKTHYVK